MPMPIVEEEAVGLAMAMMIVIATMKTQESYVNRVTMMQRVALGMLSFKIKSNTKTVTTFNDAKIILVLIALLMFRWW